MLKYLVKSRVLFLLLLGFTKDSSMTEFYKFSSQSNLNAWRIVNDGVMGGISTSSLTLTEAGNGKFSGHVSLENYGGFASVQLDTNLKLAPINKTILLRVKGDGKAYEFRLKALVTQAESYVHPFKTSGDWEIISLDIKDFFPQFRGRKLSSPNFNFDNIAQISFLIANKQEEDFSLLIDWIGI